MRRSRYPSARDALRWLTAFAFTVVGAVALIGNRIQAAGNDAVFTQSLVNRAARLGGTYYDNGITPKGPLEDVAHDIALRVGGYDGHFYVISIMVAISAVLLGLAAARTAQTTGGNRYVALAVGATVFVHFTFSNAAYAGLLYSRNILVTLLAVQQSKFAMYHCNQGLVLTLAAFVVSIANMILDRILIFIPFLGLLLMSILSLGIFIGIIALVIMGIINAANGVCKPLPVIGNRFTLVK